MKIALINPPYFEVYKGYEKAAKIGANYPPIGLLYLHARLQQDGHDVHMFDAAAENLGPEDLLKKVIGFDPGLIGITATTPIFHRTSKIARTIKDRLNVPIVVGGIHVTILPEDSFNGHDEFDYAVLGEGEVTLSELTDCLQKGGDPGSVRGILYRKNGSVVKTPPRPLAPDLDAFPFPARDCVDKHNYVWTAPGKGELPVGSIITKRGCPFFCTFCSQHSMFTRTVRYRSVENILDELEEMVTRQGYEHIIFLDDTLALKRDRMLQICDGIKNRKLDFTWEAMCRANLVDRELLQAMAGAGLARISFGIESGDQDVLDRIKKGITLNQIRMAYKWSKEAGIETRGSAIIGHPDETRKSAWRTIRFLSSIRHLDQVYINIMVPYPGTLVFDLAKKGEAGYRLLSDNYSNYIRYNQSVLEVNDLDLKALKRLQNLGLWMFYLKPRRVLYNLKRAGLRNGIRMAFAMLRGLLSRPATQLNNS